MSKPRLAGQIPPGARMAVAKDSMGRPYAFVDMAGMERDGVRVVEWAGPGNGSGALWRLRCSHCGAQPIVAAWHLRQCKGWRTYCCRPRGERRRILGKTFGTLEVLDVLSSNDLGDRGSWSRRQTLARLRCLKCGLRFRSHARWVGRDKHHPRCPGCSGGRSRA